MSNKDDTADSTTDHHLVGSVLPGSILLPIGDHYAVEERPLTLERFYKEQPAHRQPALWRGHVAGNATTSLSMDRTASDLEAYSIGLAPRLSILEARLSAVLYRHVVDEWLPSLIAVAAIEEVNAVWLRSQAASNLSSSALQWSVPRYYTASPSSYLPATSSASHSTSSAQSLPISFTPSQLVLRIKAGCALLWKEYLQRHGWSDTGVGGARRVSTRIRSSAAPSLEDDPSRYWKVAVGGKVAEYLSQHLAAALEPKTAAEPAPSQVHKNKASAVPNKPPAAVDPVSLTVATAIDGDPTAIEGGAETTKPAAVTTTTVETTLLAAAPTTSAAAPAVSGEEPANKTEVAVEETPFVAQAESAAVAPVASASGETDVEPSAPAAVLSAETNAPMTAVAPASEAPDGTVETAKEDAVPTAPESVDAPMAEATETPVEKESLNDDDVGEEEEEPATPADKEDEDFSPVNGDEEEEEGAEDETSGGDYVKENLRDLALEKPPSSKEDDMEVESTQVDVEEEEDTEDIDTLQADNPYFSISDEAIVEWLGRKTAKLLSVNDLQPGFTPLVLQEVKRKGKRKASEPIDVGLELDELLSSLDRRIWNLIMDRGLPVEGTDTRLVFQVATEHEDEDVEHWETSYFGRTQFTMRLVDDTNWGHGIASAADAALAEAEFKQKKAWDTWRHKGIHGGCTIWPSWFDTVAAWRKQAAGASNMNGAAVTDQRDASLDADAAMDDAALAQQLAQQDSVAEPATRRTRRGGETGGVFYGNQSNMTAKQLMELVLRLVSQKGFHTAVGLLSGVSDDSSDPLRRLRTALGRLVYKRNQLALLNVQSEWSDAPIKEFLSDKPLFRLEEGRTTREKQSVTGVVSLCRYLQTLHETELELRRLVLKYWVNVPVTIIATAADERPGSTEAMDAVEYENDSSIEWLSTGHDLLGRRIFRPAELYNTDDRTPCYWYQVKSYAKSVASESEEAATERPSIGSAKEPTAVHRRMRFKAVPCSPPNSGYDDSESEQGALLLTEAQVHAGLKASEIEQGRSDDLGPPENPFAGESGSFVTLFPVDGAQKGAPINGTVVGYNTVAEGGKLQQKILFLPEKGSSRLTSMWATLDMTGESSIHCTVDGESLRFMVQQFDYHTDSPAFAECQGIVNYLQRHPKAGPFLEPVDPVKFNIPTYFDVVKNPMDVSTLAKNLEKGKYSNIPPSQTVGRSPIARMLNGPFRRDVELIFDNAMLFNPPDDWIHIYASTIKKAVLKKIEQLSNSADEKSLGSARKKRSLYIDYDSDDVYVYESDKDDDYDEGRRGGRKRKRDAKTVLKEDTAARAVERSFRLQKLINESGLRGRLADIPVNSDATSFTLPSDWLCCYRDSSQATSVVDVEEGKEFDELVALHRQIEENEASGLRRSTRAHQDDEPGSSSSKVGDVEFLSVSNELAEDVKPPSNRLEIEVIREKMHEEVYAKSFKEHQSLLVKENIDGADPAAGTFTTDSFPPYLGRVVPASDDNDVVWEIRADYVVTALRWVIRGLIRSGHLGEIEPITPESLSSGVVIANNVYYIDDREPFEELDSRELIRRKRSGQGGDESSEEEIELSEYERLRAERVKRNEERLKALGLA